MDKKTSKQRVVMLGSGNVATNFALALKDKHEIVQIYSRSLGNAQMLAEKVGCEAVDDLKMVVGDAHVYIVAVNDDAIASIIDNTPCNNALWLHTSGSTPIEVFEGKRSNYGVCWPVQSLSKSNIVKMDNVHIFIEGNTDMATRELEKFASVMSQNVHKASSHDRLLLHIASVFACNFANHMFTLSSEVLDEAGIPFDAMLPLIKTTVEKLDHLTPQESQTGPAARGDIKIIEKHLATLKGDKRKIYKLLSESIMQSKGVRTKE
ncbi:MAG: DUF2520 domain-containing protein [Muribaculaceae bacterium]|nr:DUF2520 domain-containing protein [Muribaculaceae bacterium]